MQASTFSLILLSVTLSALAQACFKIGMTGASPGTRSMVAALTSPGVLGGLALYGIGTLLWLQVLSRTDLSQAYPFVGLGFVVTTMIGIFFFGETVSALRAVGITAVIIGVFAIARS